MSDLFGNSHIHAALYLTDQGCYLFKGKIGEDGTIVKNLREADVSAAFSHASKDSGWLPAGILRVGNTVRGPWFVSYAARQTVKIILAERGGFTVPLPATVLFGYRGAYHLLALAGETFSPESVVYKAPFPNLHEDGAICWGNNPVPKVNPAKAPAVWKLFFEAPFTDHLSNGKCKSFPDDVRTLLEKTAGAAEFPVEELVSMAMSIGRLVDLVLRGDQS